MLSFKEKRAIQKDIKANYELLEAEKGFKAKRELQKAIKELYAKLSVDTKPEAGTPIPDANIVDDVNNGEVINNNFLEWQAIKNESDQKEWADKVRALKFGTYNNNTILDIIDAFNPKKGFPYDDYIKEVKNALKESVAEVPEAETAINPDIIERLSQIRDVLQSENFTLQDLNGLNRAVRKIEEVESSLLNNDLYNEVIELYRQAIDSRGVTVDSVGGALLDGIEMDGFFNFGKRGNPKYEQQCMTVAKAYEEYHRGKISETEYRARIKKADMVSRGVKRKIESAVMKNVDHYTKKDVVLLDGVDADSSKKERTFQTYKAWKRAVKQLNPKAKFTGDEDIDSSFVKGNYDAEWDGDIGSIRMMDVA